MEYFDQLKNTITDILKLISTTLLFIFCFSSYFFISNNQYLDYNTVIFVFRLLVEYLYFWICCWCLSKLWKFYLFIIYLFIPCNFVKLIQKRKKKIKWEVLRNFTITIKQYKSNSKFYEQFLPLYYICLPYINYLFSMHDTYQRQR